MSRVCLVVGGEKSKKSGFLLDTFQIIVINSPPRLR
jgi:hypothetical protein